MCARPDGEQAQCAQGGQAAHQADGPDQAVRGPRPRGTVPYRTYRFSTCLFDIVGPSISLIKLSHVNLLVTLVRTVGTCFTSASHFSIVSVEKWGTFDIVSKVR